MKNRKNPCASCDYWRRLSGAAGSRRACHFLLVTHRARRRDRAGNCLDYKKHLQSQGKGETIEP